MTASSRSKIQLMIGLLLEDEGSSIRAATQNTSKYPHMSRLLPQGPKFLDFDLIRDWLARCEGQHAHCQERSALESDISKEGLLVIDVLLRCIVPASRKCRCIALSYVWGKRPAGTAQKR
ncbi:hypothetical protein BKA58DRAFT_225713 [Alternaria rosae]|uniref:uncharacterized protein n=1 Tax=Alternaria rosae TaxID=1187941 RepID=UPI001E8E8820|nr:uncharacterized protein BKA58DRAFT_225713 [Alternaria rosae]KAH6865676.1 hypothetical protein BKA58DRAFT_225713 [Alternaria rosae]